MSGEITSRCIGRVQARRDGYYEAFDRDEQSLGVFATEVEAAIALIVAAPDPETVH